MSDLEHDLALISEALDESIPWIPSEFDNAGVCLARDGRNALDRLRAELAAAQTRSAALERALATCDAALEQAIEAAEFQARRHDPKWDGNATPGSALGMMREARRAAKEALR